MAEALNEDAGHKKCSKCGQVKLHSDFGRDRNKRDGLMSCCKACKREYRLSNAERIAERGREYYQANREHVAEYYQANRERIAERNREHRQANLDRFVEKDREYYQANRERIAEQKAEYYRANAEQIAERNFAYRFGITADQYAALLAHQGRKCAGCGVAKCPSGRRFAIDHDHTCCPPTQGSMTIGACGKCVRGLVCIVCNTNDVLVGRPPVDWFAVMGGAP